MSGFRERNGAILDARFPGLRARIAATSGETALRELALSPAARGGLTFSVDGRWVHSRVDPVKEAERLAELAAGEGPLVVLGLGLGYAAEAALAAAPERPLVIVERDARILDFVLDSRDLRALLSRPRLAIVVGGDPADAAAALEAAGGGRPAVVSNRALRELDPEWYDEAERALRTWSTKDEVNGATLRRFGTRWVRNLVSNIEAIRDLPGIALLEGCAEGLPALLVAAGPSLDEVLPRLPEISRRCVLVVVDTALRAVLGAGAMPDFVLVVDPQYWNARHLDRCPVPDSVVVTESAVYPSVLRHPRGKAFLCSSLFPLGRFVEDRVDPKGELGAGGSVATTAWDFARTIGAAPLWVAGLDLGFPGCKTHFKGALFEERVHAETVRTAPVELRSFRALRDGIPFRAPDAAGGRVLTDKRLALYAAWFESRFARHPEARPLSLSERGLRIAGMESRGIRELLDLPERRREIDIRLEAALQRADGAFGAEAARESRAAAFGRAVGDLARSLEELRGIAEEAEAAARSAFDRRSGLSGAEVGRVLEVLDGANAVIAASSAKEVAGFLFPPVAELEREVATPREDALGRHLEYSQRLYGRLAASAAFHGRLLGRYRASAESPQKNR